MDLKEARYIQDDFDNRLGEGDHRQGFDIVMRDGVYYVALVRFSEEYERFSSVAQYQVWAKEYFADE